jgi:glycine/D-amino acid oxidase-like deaminating enzyme
MKTDVVVIGAGISGALLAEALSRRGVATIILDRRPPGHGSTAASTALVQFEIDMPLIMLAERIGFERASRVWLRSFRAVQDLRRLVAKLHIDCDFRLRRGLYLAGTILGVRELAEEGRCRRMIGLPSIFLDSAALRAMEFSRDGALLSDSVADLDPIRLTMGLLHHAMSRGSLLFAPAQLAEVLPSARRVMALTTDGIELEAKSLIFATGYELPDGVPAGGHRRSSTWAFATPPQPERLWHEGELIWEASRPYLYMRTTVDGRVIVGGEDESIEAAQARDALLPTKIEALQKKVKHLFPKINVEADFAWAGTFGESDNGLPSFGPVPGMPNCFAVLGYGGNGFTFSLVAAQTIAAALSGERDPDAELFDFHRHER